MHLRLSPEQLQSYQWFACYANNAEILIVEFNCVVYLGSHKIIPSLPKADTLLLSISLGYYYSLKNSSPAPVPTTRQFPLSQ